MLAHDVSTGRGTARRHRNSEKVSSQNMCYVLTYENSMTGAIHTLAMMHTQPPSLPAGWFIGFAVCEKQESKRSMSKEGADALMHQFFAQRRHERDQEKQLLCHRLQDAQGAADSLLASKEWVSDNVLDSVNFLKHEAGAEPPETASGSMTQAMMAALTSDEARARELANRVESAGLFLGSALQGALKTMTGEAAASHIHQNLATQAAAGAAREAAQHAAREATTSQKSFT